MFYSAIFRRSMKIFKNDLMKLFGGVIFEVLSSNKNYDNPQLRIFF